MGDPNGVKEEDDEETDDENKGGGGGGTLLQPLALPTSPGGVTSSIGDTTE
jgi:hypothetical protein